MDRLTDNQALALLEATLVDLDVYEGDDSLVHGRAIEKQLRAAGFLVLVDNAPKDGHEHVALLVDKKTRERLNRFLYRPDMRGIGYTTFIETALNLLEQAAK